jgi:dynein heavy chain
MQQTKEVGSTAKIPEDASKMYQENEKFVSYVTNLDYTTKSYNKIRLTILDVEKPLVEKQLEEIDRKLLRAQKELSWSTAGKNLFKHFSSIINFIINENYLSI